MARLPSNTFWVNYNAKKYNPDTHTIPKTEGQLFDVDMTLNNAPSGYTSESIILNGQYFDYTFPDVNSNMFRRSGNDSMTIIAKIKKSLDASGEHCIFSCRNSSALNYMLFASGSRDIVFLHNSQRFYNYCPYVQMSAEPNIFYIQVSGGSGYGVSVTDNATFRSIGNTYGGNNTNRIGFFTDSYATGGFELWRSEFYWIYISPEALTVEEIQQVIDFNEKGSFGPDIEELDFGVSGGTSTVTLDSDNPWTATTNDNWITLSQYSGETGGTITVSVSANEYLSVPRTGTVEFTDGESIATLTITQSGNTIVILKNLYRGGNRVRQMFRNGVKIYQLLIKD